MFNQQTMAYLVWEREVGEQGTTHLQGYVRFHSRLRMGQVAQIFPRAHLSLARGSEEQNRTYCTKGRGECGSDFGEEGQFQKEQGVAGRRTDLKRAVEILKERGLDALIEEDPVSYVQYSHGLTKLAETLQQKPPSMRPVETIILWGEPGTGKTYRTVIKYPEAYKVRVGRDPFGDYQGEKIIVFDEYDFEKWPIELMNELCDIYRLRLDCRYSNKWAYWEKIIIISNINPGYWWQYAPQVKKDAFMRRVVKIVEVTNKEESIDF